MAEAVTFALACAGLTIAGPAHAGLKVGVLPPNALLPSLAR